MRRHKPAKITYFKVHRKQWRIEAKVCYSAVEAVTSYIGYVVGVNLNEECNIEMWYA